VRILFLSTDFVWPADSGGRVRTLSQLRVLSSLAEVEHIRFFSMRESNIAVEQRDALARQVPKLDVAEPVFHPIHLLRHPRYVPHVAWLRLARGVPYVAGKWDSPAVRAAVRRELESRAYDVVWLNGLGIARYLPLARSLQPRARVVLDQHNVESDRFVQFARRQRGLRRLVADAEARAARRWERDVLRAVDAVGAISRDDARAYRELAGVEALTVPQLVPLAERKAEAEGPGFCWVGNLSWGPNARGLDWFCDEVWPRVRARLPDATVEIVGSGLAMDAGGNAIAPTAWRAPGITTLGFVADLAPVYARSIAMVAPILGGAGIRIKLLEAFRYGVPAVTTPDGAAGLPIEPGREAFVESDAEAFAERLLQLATSRATRERLRDAGYAFLARHNQVAEAQAAVSSLLGCSEAHAARATPWASIAVS
jgi:glycosyltransferase involved in cell wall biosynthesis